jgi:hypothetical protein
MNFDICMRLYLIYSQPPRRPQSAAPSLSTSKGRPRQHEMRRPKSSASLLSDLASESATGKSKNNTTSILREQCNWGRIREREKQ